ncbi:MAG: M20/M25/M40 family metallo-hydrolase [Clostridia bacterium]|nr:M20/M25/M40 family metallo-hydrolase [Clostridia bacterium]
MKCEKIFAEIDALNDSYIKVWEDVCNIESPTKYKAGVDAVGKYFADLAKERGWDVEIFEQPISGNVVCVTMNPNAKGSPICLSGHMDTVHPVGAFGTPAVKIDGEKIYGPGVTDCKGGIVAGFLAMDALSRCGFVSRPIRMLLQSDEEVSSIPSNKATIGYICEKAKDSIAFLNLEGHTHGEVCVQRKGIATFTFAVSGVEAHSSNCATAGANAIAEAAHKILELEKLKDDEGLTCNCGLIQGGTVVNTVPGYCEFKANVRFATQEQLDWVKAYMQQVADTVYIKGCSTKVTVSSCRLAMERVERNLELVEKMNRAFSANGLSALTPAMRKGGSDAADVTAYGIPCVDSVGAEGGKIHSPEEFAYLASLAASAKRIAAVAVELE